MLRSIDSNAVEMIEQKQDCNAIELSDTSIAQEAFQAVQNNAPMPNVTSDALFLRIVRDRLVPTHEMAIWIMRQAGRYLPEFRATRAPHDFFTVCQTPVLACQVTLQPLLRYPQLDASIIFSDILVVPQALGCNVIMAPGKGPTFPDPIREPKDLDRLTPVTDLKQHIALYSTCQAIRVMREAIRIAQEKLGRSAVPLLGFIGAPWTLAGYMIEGGGSRTYLKAKQWLYCHPEASHRLLTLITDACIIYAVGQVEAGAECLQVFDSWAGELSPDLYLQFALPYTMRIAKALREKFGASCPPLLLFARNMHDSHVFREMIRSQCIGSPGLFDGLSLDYSISVEHVDSILEELKVPKNAVVLQGNLDPAALFENEADLTQRVHRMITAFKKTERPFVCNLGHGMMPEHSPEMLLHFLSAVKNAN